jgi:hypothetical protein
MIEGNLAANSSKLVPLDSRKPETFIVGNKGRLH